MIGIAIHQRCPFIVSHLVGVGIANLALSHLETTLREAPTVFSDVQLIELAHLVAGLYGDATSSVIDLSGEQWAFDDMIQRTYSDDGHGDGRLTPAGASA